MSTVSKLPSLSGRKEIVSLEQILKLAELDKKVVNYPAYTDAVNLLARHVEMNIAANLGSVLFVSGLSGVGKTKVVSALKARLTENAKICVYVKVRSGEDARTLALKLLRAVNCPIRVPTKFKDAEIMEIVVDQFKGRGVTCLIVDEAQNMTNNRRGYSIHSVAEAFASDMDDFQIPVVLVGTEELEDIRLSFGPLSRRSGEVIRLEPFDTATPQGFANLRKLLGALNNMVPIKLTNWLLTDAGLSFLRMQTAGLIGVLIPLIRHAQRHALICSEKEITKERLIASAKTLATEKYKQVKVANTRLISVDDVLVGRRKSA